MRAAVTVVMPIPSPIKRMAFLAVFVFGFLSWISLTPSLYHWLSSWFFRMSPLTTNEPRTFSYSTTRGKSIQIRVFCFLLFFFDCMKRIVRKFDVSPKAEVPGVGGRRGVHFPCYSFRASNNVLENRELWTNAKCPAATKQNAVSLFATPQ